MAKENLLINPAFQRKEVLPGGFNLVAQANNFSSVFDVKPLDVEEGREIEKLLIDNFQGEEEGREQLSSDAAQIKALTAEIRAIGKQGIILMGERVHKAREILKPYRDGTFTKWIESAFGARRTGYNVLSYYELYMALPGPELKENFKRIPQKAAYVLASRTGELEVKAEIVREYGDQPLNEIILMIQEKLPAAEGDKRSSKRGNVKLIYNFQQVVKQIFKRKTTLSEEDKKALAILRSQIDEIIDPS